ncbi:lytic murein transglycosylase [Thiofilum flexile]|uniref:lytic murein transglycosylase n=1 Tax=Thiofilum flexile TaxID=125627 RepID=UPI00037C1026|nr:lytic murein transglycosylase [Thiofilum flexile]
MRILSIGLLLSSLALQSAWACQNTADFQSWLSDFKQKAAREGISNTTIEQTLSSVKFDPSVIQRDRSQGVFAQTFLQFSDKKVSSNRISTGRNQLKKNAALFNRIEARYGVPAEVLTAFWGLETDFGAVLGDFSTIPALATLAYDCRRPERFRPELMHALWLVQKGDMTPAKMRGAWAGELGQLQFLPSGYNLHGVDFDGDGHRNIIASKADALASAASLLKNYGWRAGEPWLLEVKVPKQMDWAKARLDNKLPISTWKAEGVTLPSGKPLPNNGVAALLLPMGRNGPAFLAYPNFDAYLQWNESSVYSLTAAYFATRLAGAPALKRGNAPIATLSLSQVKTLQKKLRAAGFKIEKIDGIIGQETMSATRKLQQQKGLPADGYPDLTFFNQL